MDIKESSQEKDRCGSRKSVGLLLFLSWLVYTVGNVGRLNYSASMVAIIDDIGATKSEAGLVASFFFFAYGFGQLVNGLLCHKYNTRIVVFCSLIAAASANIGLPLCRSVGAMKWIWLLNGAVQSVLWSNRNEYNDCGGNVYCLWVISTQHCDFFLASYVLYRRRFVGNLFCSLAFWNRLRAKELV